MNVNPNPRPSADTSTSICDLEPIHAPGAIQPHGAFLAALADGQLVTHASANLEAILGRRAEDVLGRPLPEVIGEAAARHLSYGTLGHFEIQSLHGSQTGRLHLAAHHTARHICVDIETTCAWATGAPRMSDALSILDNISEAGTRLELCDRVVAGLKSLTGYDRVMAYRFGADGHGEVIAEARNPELHPYLGQFYPASDIPAQVRRHYLRQRVGAIVDSSYLPVMLLTAPLLDGGEPLDLTHSALRSVSPIHRQYMRNMKTAASLTIGLNRRDALWGMLVCHHGTPRSVSPELRAAVGMIGRVVSLLLASLGELESYKERSARDAVLQALTLRLAAHLPLLDVLVQAEQELLQLVNAVGAAVRLSGHVVAVGKTPPIAMVEQALRLIRPVAGRDVVAMEDLALRYPELADCKQYGSGALLLPLSQGNDDAILWFRPELRRTITWGGNPAEHVALQSAEALSPRASFAAWNEEVNGRSAAWSESDITLALALRTAIAAEVAQRANSELAVLRQDLLTAATRDVRLREETARQRAQMDSKYRNLLEAAPDAMVVINQVGQVVLLNLCAEAQFGYSAVELLGQPVRTILPESLGAKSLVDKIRSADGSLIQKAGFLIECSARRRDGSIFPVDVRLSPMDSAEGTLVIAAIRDISLRKQAERDLLRMEDKYRGLLEAAPDAMVMVKPNGEIVLVNRQAELHFGYHREELVGQNVMKIIPQSFALWSDANERASGDSHASDGFEIVQPIAGGAELVGQRKNGSSFPIEVILAPLPTKEGKLFTAAIRDITTRKMTEELLARKAAELHRSNAELDQFASIASHDLQEPLRMVTSYTQLLSRRYRGRLDADADEFIAFAVDGATRMQRLIQDLLTYSRIGSTADIIAETSSHDALERALMLLGGAIEESGAMITHDPMPSIVADPRQLTQLLQNLISNAIKYQRPEATPRIHVAAVRDEEKKWTFSVLDNGVGIDPQYFERIFGMFQRLHSREEFAGTGIGLAICKKILALHGSDISVESRPGQGSKFIFTLSEAPS